MDDKVKLTLVAMLGKITPFETIIDRMEESIQEYREGVLLHNEGKKEESLRKMTTVSMILLNKMADVDPLTIGKEYDEAQRLKDIFNPSKA